MMAAKRIFNVDEPALLPVPVVIVRMSPVVVTGMSFVLIYGIRAAAAYHQQNVYMSPALRIAESMLQY